MNTFSTSKKTQVLTLAGIATLAMIVFAFLGWEGSTINFMGGISLVTALATCMLAVKIHYCSE